MISKLRLQVSSSIESNKEFFQKFSNNIYVVSCGFKEFIDPIVETYNIPANRVYANTFVFDAEGFIVGDQITVSGSANNNAVFTIASLTADTLQLCQRGKLQAGYFADVVVFDPETFGPVADFSNPAELSTGIVHLFVNGAQAIKDGGIDPQLHGRPLRRADCS